MSEVADTRPAPADVHGVLDRIDVGWRELMEALDGIPEERLQEPGVVGEWSLQNLFGHLAFWDEHAVQEIERALAGQPREDTGWQELNEADHAARRGRTLAEERAAMHQAHAAVVERLEAVAGLDAARIDAAVRPGTYGHYEEHIPDIRGWRERAGV
jgi:hypothetical protein